MSTESAPKVRRSRPRLVLRLLALGVGLVFAALLAYGLLTPAADRSLDAALSDGEALPAPDFELPVLFSGEAGSHADRWREAAADGRVRLSELRGVPLVVNFWASWCDPCRVEAPRLQQKWLSAQRQGVLMVGVNEQDAREDARDFVDQFGFTFPQVRDATRDTARQWGLAGMPETFFVSTEGTVVGHVIGVVGQEQMDRGIQASLDGTPVPVSEGGDRRPIP